MKKTLVTMLAAVAMAASSYAQGTVSFVNTAGTLVQINGVSATTAAGAKVELVWAPVGTLDINLFQLVPGTAATVGSPLAGRFSGGVRTIPQGTGSGGIAAGGLALIAVRGYVGADYASATVKGITAAFQVDTGDPTTTPAGTAATITGAGLWNSTLNLTAVPEPTSMALAGLGAASLLIFRRRK
jgi:hypothetical protein